MNDVMKEFEIAISDNKISKFNFKNYEISDSEREEVEEQEEKLINSFRKYRNNLYDICNSLAIIEKVLKPSGSFMEWYMSIGLTKDMVSIYLKRWSLYCYFNEHKEKIFSLSDQAIKILSNNQVSYDDAKAILDSDISKVKDIKTLLISEFSDISSKNSDEDNHRFFDFKKIEKIEKKAKKLKAEDKEIYKKELQEYIKNIQKILEEL